MITTKRFRRIDGKTRLVVADCPVCKGPIFDYLEFYGCGNFRYGCDFKIGKRALSHLGRDYLSLQEAAALIYCAGKDVQDGKHPWDFYPIIGGLKEQNGTPFTAIGRITHSAGRGFHIQIERIFKKAKRFKLVEGGTK